MNLAMCNLTTYHEKLFTQNLTNITFREKSGERLHIISPPPEKVGGHVLRVPHKIAPMRKPVYFIMCRFRCKRIY